MNKLLQEHLGYLQLPNRAALFKAAVARTVAPGCVVLDAGCGSAVLGLLSLEAGAGRVFAVESTAAIEVARESMERAGLAAKVTFVRGSTFQVTLPERVDVVICDHVGYFGFDYGLIELLADARKRLLKPGGKLVPGRLLLQAALVESPKLHEKAAGWAAEEVPEPFRWLREHGINAKHAVNLTADELISAAADLCDLNLYEDQPEFFNWSTRLTASRDGWVHGLAGWFRTELAPDVWMSNSPLDEASIKRPQAFLPISRPFQVEQGDVMDITVMARPSERLIAWTMTHRASGQRQRQSTWLGDIVEQSRLQRLQPDRVPVLTPQARARQIVLGYCDGKRTVAQIEQAFLQEHPGYFPSAAEMKRFVAGVLGHDAL